MLALSSLEPLAGTQLIEGIGHGSWMGWSEPTHMVTARSAIDHISVLVRAHKDPIWAATAFDQVLPLARGDQVVARPAEEAVPSRSSLKKATKRVALVTQTVVSAATSRDQKELWVPTGVDRVRARSPK